jgi:hypothetical protein
LGKPRPRNLPEWLGRLIVGPIESIARLKGQETPPLLTRAQIKFLTLNLDFSIEKAKRLLGYRPRVDFQDGIIAALDYATGKHAASNVTNGTHAEAQRSQRKAKDTSFGLLFLCVLCASAVK